MPQHLVAADLLEENQFDDAAWLLRNLGGMWCFTDVAGEHLLCLGPAGRSWIPISEAKEAFRIGDVFIVAHEANAKSFAAWQANQKKYVKALTLDQVAELQKG